MKINVREDHVEIEGYVNAIERNSKPLNSRIGHFIERICKGAFKKALKRNDDVHILLNHDWSRDLGSTKKGNLELEEDNIGLKAHATITDPEVMEKARNGDLVGWSFGFQDRDVENTIERGMPYRAVKDLDLYEVSILDRRKSPAYDGTLIMARDDNSLEINIRSEITEIEDKANKEHEKLFKEEDKLHEKVEEPVKEEHQKISEEYKEKHADINEKLQDEKIEILSNKIADKVVQKLKGYTREELKDENAQNNENIVQNEVREEQNEAEPKQQEQVVENTSTIDYSKYENIIKEMKEEK